MLSRFLAGAPAVGTKHQVKRCCWGPPSPPRGARAEDGEGHHGLPLSLPPGPHLRWQPPQRAGAAGGRRAPARYRRVELSTRRGVYSCACVALGCGQALQLQRAPSSPRPEPFFFFFPLFFFFSPPLHPLLLPPPATPAGRWAASRGSCLHRLPRGGGAAVVASTPAQQPPQAAAQPEQREG